MSMSPVRPKSPTLSPLPATSAASSVVQQSVVSQGAQGASSSINSVFHNQPSSAPLSQQEGVEGAPGGIYVPSHNEQEASSLPEGQPSQLFAASVQALIAQAPQAPEKKGARTLPSTHNAVVSAPAIQKFKEAFLITTKYWALSADQATCLKQTYLNLVELLYANKSSEEFKLSFAEEFHSLNSQLLTIEKNNFGEVSFEVKEKITSFAKAFLYTFFAVNSFQSHITSDVPLRAYGMRYHNGKSGTTKKALENFDSQLKNSESAKPFSLSFASCLNEFKLLKKLLIPINTQKDCVILGDLEALLLATAAKESPASQVPYLHIESKKIFAALKDLALSKSQAFHLWTLFQDFEKTIQSSSSSSSSHSSAQPLDILLKKAYTALYYEQKKSGFIIKPQEGNNENQQEKLLQQFMQKFALILKTCTDKNSFFNLKDLQSLLSIKKNVLALKLNSEHIHQLTMPQSIQNEPYLSQQNYYENFKLNIDELAPVEDCASDASLTRRVFFSNKKMEFVEIHSFDEAEEYIHTGPVITGTYHFAGEGARYFPREQKIIIGDFQGNKLPSHGEIHTLNAQGTVGTKFQGSLKNGEPLDGIWEMKKKVDDKKTVEGVFDRKGDVTRVDALYFAQFNPETNKYEENALKVTGTNLTESYLKKSSGGFIGYEFHFKGHKIKFNIWFGGNDKPPSEGPFLIDDMPLKIPFIADTYGSNSIIFKKKNEEGRIRTPLAISNIWIKNKDIHNLIYNPALRNMLDDILAENIG